MAKIEFRNKKMNLLEAKALLVGLKTGVVKLELTEEERKDHNEWEEMKRKTNEKAIKRHGGEGIFIYFNEQEYIANELSKEIKMEEDSRKVNYCKKHGHKEAYAHIAVGHSGSGVYCQCARCGMPYKRNLTSKEWNDFDRAMHKLITI